jgi:predicted dehydrogenase
MLYDTYGHTPVEKAFAAGDVYGVGYDATRAARRPVRLALFGGGGVAQSKYFPAVARLRMLWEPIEIVAVAEPREQQGRKIEAVYGARWYPDAQRLLASEEIDGAVITGPDGYHAELATAALERDLDVLVEKPITRSLVQAHALCELAQRRGRVLAAVAMLRCSPPHRRARAMLDDGSVRAPALLTGKFNLGYDYVDLLESGTIHLLDLVRFYLGDVARVHALGVNRHRRHRHGYPLDNIAIGLEFCSGAVGSLVSSASALSLKPWFRLEIYGDRGWLAIEDTHELLLYDSEEGPAKSWRPVFANTLYFDEEFGGYTGMVESFAQSIRRLAPPVASGLDGLRAYELAVAAHLSVARGVPVELPLDPAGADAELADWLASAAAPGAQTHDAPTTRGRAR